MSTQAVLVAARGRLVTALNLSAFGSGVDAGLDSSVVCENAVKLTQQIANSNPINLFVICLIRFLKSLADAKDYSDTLGTVAGAEFR